MESFPGRIVHTCEMQSRRKLPLMRKDDLRKLRLLRKEDLRKELSLAWIAAGLKRWLSFRDRASAASSPSGSDSRFRTWGLLCAAHRATNFVTHAKKKITEDSNATNLGVGSTPCTALATANQRAMVTSASTSPRN